jgi:hypothetical protein
MFCSMGTTYANELMNSDDLVSQRVQAVVAEKAVAEDAKKASPVDNMVKAGKVVFEHADSLKKMGAEAVEDFKTGQAKYDDLCAKHVGDLKWYHKVKYGFMAYVAPVVKVLIGLGKDVVVPLVQAFA